MNTTLKTSKKLRKAKPAEVQEIVVLANRTFDNFYRPFLGDHNVNWYVNSGELKREIVKHANDLYVVLLNDEIKGFVIYFNDFIHFMMVDEEAHRSGMGSFMLTEVEKELFKNNDQIKLQSFVGNEIATNFYLKNG
ncbi:MAG: GNAT family N-acetyltransferase, partial [Urechidicola sp.]|nr:GNAT family N-acetyltransferase [Urechidicola sp.]